MDFWWQTRGAHPSPPRNPPAAERYTIWAGSAMTENDFLSGLQRHHARICNMIFHMDVEWIDIEIQINEMREFCREHCPERLELFDMIYPNRFRRLFETWGPDSRVG
jgi:hypothetical protein